MMFTPLARVASAALLLLVAGACSKKDAAPADSAATATPPAPAPAPAVSTIELGRQLGADKRITKDTSVFAPRDTIYLVVVTENTTPSSNLVARWSFQDGQVVDSTSQAVAGAGGGQAVTEFHVAKPSGWPAGNYKVEILLDGARVGTRDFEVKKK